MKLSKIVKEKVKKLIELYKNLYKIVKLVQKYIRKYYNLKKFKGLDLNFLYNNYTLSPSFKFSPLNFLKL